MCAAFTNTANPEYVHISFTLSNRLQSQLNEPGSAKLVLLILSSPPSSSLCCKPPPTPFRQCCPTAARILAQVWTLGMPGEGKHDACRMRHSTRGMRRTILLDVDGAEYAAAAQQQQQHPKRGQVCCQLFSVRKIQAICREQKMENEKRQIGKNHKRALSDPTAILFQLAFHNAGQKGITALCNRPNEHTN